jgi:hypothetical protein
VTSALNARFKSNTGWREAENLPQEVQTACLAVGDCAD